MAQGELIKVRAERVLARMLEAIEHRLEGKAPTALPRLTAEEGRAVLAVTRIYLAIVEEEAVQLAGQDFGSWKEDDLDRVMGLRPRKRSA